jgi:hypothetical protein
MNIASNAKEQKSKGISVRERDNNDENNKQRNRQTNQQRKNYSDRISSHESIKDLVMT